MTNTIALSSIYLLMLFAFAAGIKSLTGDDCSDWLVNCPGAEAVTLPSSDKDGQPGLPDDPEHR